MTRWPRILGGVLLALLVAPAVMVQPSDAADPHGTGALGMSRFSQLAAEAERDVVTLFASEAALRDIDRVAVLLVPGVPSPLTTGEARALEQHLDQGRSLWLLDETGHANELTRERGVIVVPEEVLDPESPFGDPRLVEGTAEIQLTEWRLLFTAPTLLEVDTELATVWARTDEAFRDVDRSGEIGPGDPGGRHPVIALVDTGSDARLIAIADTGVFTNTVLGTPGYENAAFVTELLADEAPGIVVFDATRHGPPRWMATLKLVTGTSLELATEPVSAALLLGAAVGLGALLTVRAPRRAAWGVHDHDLSTVLPPPPGEAGERLRRLLVHALHERTGRDAAELVALEPVALENLANTHLGTGQPLSGKGEMEAHFRALVPIIDGDRSLDS